MNLTGKTALVTGSTSGIGLGIAQVLAQAGATILVAEATVYGTPDPAIATQALLKAARAGVASA